MFTKTSSWTRLKSIQSSLVLFSACFDLLLYVYTIWKSADQLLFLYDQRRRLSLNEGEYLWKIPYSSKIDPRDFRTEILLIPLRIARYFWFCAGVNSKTLLNSGGLKNLPTSESRYTLNSTPPRQKTSWNTLFIQFFKTFSLVQYAPFYLQNERTGVPVLFVYCSCDYDPYFDRSRCEVLPEVQGLQVHSISGSWWDWWHLVRKLEVNLKAVNITCSAWKIIAILLWYKNEY